MTGIAPKTLEFFEQISSLSCIKEYVLIGGTALSVQINHRLSEDLDFCKWVPVSNTSNAIAWRQIEKELRAIFKEVEVNPLSFDQADFLINGAVKLQFINEVGYRLSTHEFVSLKNNIRLAPLEAIAAMKIKTMFQRTTYRDYYDVFVLLKERHISIQKLIEVASYYDIKLNSRKILARLNDWKVFDEERKFNTLSPRYNISPEEIGNFISHL